MTRKNVHNNNKLVINCCWFTGQTIKFLNLHEEKVSETSFYWKSTGLMNAVCDNCKEKWQVLDKTKVTKNNKLSSEDEIELRRKEVENKAINIDDLYSYFSKSPKKLKIVCDWDEVIQAVEPKVYHQLSTQSYYEVPWWVSEDVTFEEYLKWFWYEAPIDFSYYGTNCKYDKDEVVLSYLPSSNIPNSVKIKDKIDEIKNHVDFYDSIPFLNVAKDLLKLVKENKVEIIFLSTYDEAVFSNGDYRIQKIFQESFGKFSDCSFKLISKKITKRDWVKVNHPDLDMIIDNNPMILDQFLENNNQWINKVIAIAPYYSPNIKHNKNVLLVRNYLSDFELKNLITNQMNEKEIIHNQKEDKFIKNESNTIKDDKKREDHNQTELNNHINLNQLHDHKKITDRQLLEELIIRVKQGCININMSTENEKNNIEASCRWDIGVNEQILSFNINLNKLVTIQNEYQKLDDDNKLCSTCLYREKTPNSELCNICKQQTTKI